MKHVFIDTDVILDFFFDRQPFSDAAASVLSLCETEQIKGYVTPVILSKVYYLLRQNARHQIVLDKIRDLLSILELANISRKVMLQAIHSNFKDFEDALQNYAAEENGQIEIILTRNHKDFKNSKLSVMSPEQYLKGFHSK